LDVALSTLWAWMQDAARLEARDWFPGGTGGDPDPRTGEEALLAFDPGHEMSITPDTRRETRKDFLDRASAHYDWVLAKSKEAGLTKAHAHGVPEHFRWLVEFQVLERTWAQIRAKNRAKAPKKVTPKAISLGARRPAKYLEPTIRPR